MERGGQRWQARAGLTPFRGIRLAARVGRWVGGGGVESLALREREREKRKARKKVVVPEPRVLLPASSPKAARRLGSTATTRFASCLSAFFFSLFFLSLSLSISGAKILQP